MVVFTTAWHPLCCIARGAKISGYDTLYIFRDDTREGQRRWDSRVVRYVSRPRLLRVGHAVIRNIKLLITILKKEMD